MEYGGKVLSRIVSVLQAIHGRKVPVEIVKYSVKERENGELLVEGEYRLIVSSKTKGFVAILNENSDVKYLERIERITWKHPTFEKASLFIA